MTTVQSNQLFDWWIAGKWTPQKCLKCGLFLLLKYLFCPTKFCRAFLVFIFLFSLIFISLKCLISMSVCLRLGFIIHRVSLKDPFLNSLVYGEPFPYRLFAVSKVLIEPTQIFSTIKKDMQTLSMQLRIGSLISRSLFKLWKKPIRDTV